MARSTATRLDPEPPPPPVAVLDEADVEEQDDIEGVISQVADEAATVQIKRWNPNPDDPGKPWDYITTVAARDFNLEAIKREFGGGRYKATTLDRAKKYVRGGQHLFNVDRMFKPAPKEAAPEATPAAGKAAVSSDVAALVAKVDQLAALVAANNSTKETLDYALKIAAVMGGRAQGGASPDAIFTTATKLIEFSRTLGGGGEGGGGGGEEVDPYAVAIRELVKPVASLIQSEVERRAARERVAPGARPAQLTTGEGATVTVPPWVVQLRPYLPQLLTLARDNADPALYADVVFDVMERRLPAAQLAAITDAAAAEGFTDTVLGALPPACVPFKEWFRVLVVNLKATLVAPSSPGGDDDDDDNEAPLGAAPTETRG